jgi:hypothetical protein
MKQKLKSWHLVLMGILLHIVLGLIFYPYAEFTTTNDWLILPYLIISIMLGGWISIAPICIFWIPTTCRTDLWIYGDKLLLASIFGVITLPLLLFKKTKIIGSKVSIIFGITGVAFTVVYLLTLFRLFSLPEQLLYSRFVVEVLLTLRSSFLIGIFLILAGKLALQKEVSKD